MKKYFSYILFIIISLCFISNVNAYDKISDTSLKIYDYADYLTVEEEATLKEKIDNYIEKYNMDMVIVTKKDYDYYSMQSYAQDFYDYNGFGVGEHNAGIILFYNVDSEGPAVWMTTTGEAILTYDDARISRMKSSMSSAKRSGHYKIIETFINDATKYAEAGIPESNKYAYIDENGEYKINYERQRIDRQNANYDRYWLPKYILGSLIFSLIVGTVTLLVLVKKNKTIRKESGAKEYLDSKSVNFTDRSNVFVGTHTTKKYVGSTSSGSSGGSHHSGGGSSISHGSSGVCHGGGGGRL